MKVLVATEKPFAKIAVDGIREVVEKNGYELALLEKYTDVNDLYKAVADADALIVRSDKVTKEVIDRQAAENCCPRRCRLRQPRPRGLHRQRHRGHEHPRSKQQRRCRTRHGYAGLRRP